MEIGSVELGNLMVCLGCFGMKKLHAWILVVCNFKECFGVFLTILDTAWMMEDELLRG